MSSPFPLFPESASSLSGDVDLLFVVWSVISIFFTALIAGLILYFMVRYRRRYTRGNRQLAQLFPTLPGHDVKRYRGATKELLSRPSRWPAAFSTAGWNPWPMTNTTLASWISST